MLRTRSTELSAFSKLTTRLLIITRGKLKKKNHTSLHISATSNLNYSNFLYLKIPILSLHQQPFFYVFPSIIFHKENKTKGTPASFPHTFPSHLSILTVEDVFSSGSYFFSYTQSRTSHTYYLYSPFSFPF